MEESNCERDHQAHTQADSTPDYRRVPDIRFRGFTYAWELRNVINILYSSAVSLCLNKHAGAVYDSGNS